MLKKVYYDDFDAVYSIMEKSFPSDERRSYEKQRALLDEKKYSVFALQGEKSIKAFISTFVFNDFAYVEHFAVSPDFRNQGLGSIILNELKSTLNKSLCLEVELPNTELAKRRIDFYKRNGFYLNDYPYMQPPFSSDKNAVPLLVMTTERTLDKAEFERVKSVLYKEVYRVSGKLDF